MATLRVERGSMQAQAPAIARCPWCLTEYEGMPAGTWRCQRCTGYWRLKSTGTIKRLYFAPSSPTVVFLSVIVAIGFVLLLISALQ